MLLALYVFTTLTASAGLLGHTPVLGRAVRWTLAWRPHRGTRGSRTAEAPPGPADARVRPRPSWAHEQPTTYQEAA